MKQNWQVANASWRTTVVFVTVVVVFCFVLHTVLGSDIIHPSPKDEAAILHNTQLEMEKWLSRPTRFLKKRDERQRHHELDTTDPHDFAAASIADLRKAIEETAEDLRRCRQTGGVMQ